MQGYNIIVIFNDHADRVLMCKRRKNPYKGLSNFVGGKIEDMKTGWMQHIGNLKKKQQ